MHINQLILYFFRIRHYAGAVTYSVHGFVEKNRDTLPREVSRAMFRCDHPIIPMLFPEGNPKRCNPKRPVSKSFQLQVSLNSLLKELSGRQAHYIRCLKPNEMKQPRIFEMALIQHQVCNRFIKPLYNFYCLILQLFSFLTKELYLNVKIENRK